MEDVEIVDDFEGEFLHPVSRVRLISVLSDNEVGREGGWIGCETA